MPDENLQAILLKMSERLARIEQSLCDKSCDRHEQWLGAHEKRIRATEERITAISVITGVAGTVLSFVGGVFAYWVSTKL